LQLPNAGDDLQAIKRGIVELADIVVINKADIDPRAAGQAKHQFASALTLLHSASEHWRPRVLTASGSTGAGIEAFWAEIEHHHKIMTETGELELRRQRQAVDWMWTLIDSGLRSRFQQHPRVKQDIESIRCAVAAGMITPSAAADRLLGYVDQQRTHD
jgi:LAO/AO transport system kinase